MTAVDESGEEAVTPTVPAVVPNPSFTLSTKRLKGSAECLNCGTGLAGPYCHYCGQPDRNFMRFFPALLREFLEEFLDLDSRFARTMKPLLLIPGKLTRDFLDGRRFRYTPPLRLYLFSSIAFFVLLAFISSLAVDSESIRTDGNDSDSLIQINANNEEELEEARLAIEALPPEIRDQIGIQPEDLDEDTINDDDFFEEGEITLFGDEPWDAENNPVAIGWLPVWMNDWINKEVAESPKKAKRISEDPMIILDQIFDIAPIVMFVLLPVAAMILKFWYLFSSRYYIEHLIMALHNHSFMFVGLTAAFLVDWLADIADSRGLEWAVLGADIFAALIMIWMPIYMMLSLKRVYQQGWFLTISKTILIGLSYLFLLMLVTSVVAILGFILVR